MQELSTLAELLREHNKVGERISSIIGGQCLPVISENLLRADFSKSLTDVAQAGGWKDIATVLRCYTQADNETILTVMSEPKKLREKAVSA